ncbi:hypothetical protein [Pedobacter aquatilis]|uniref:hypothetical protein n=1 Tax=Pedobacter aquatilis TaxID=351343 RepID=UPI0029309467|nr:hypothetical protein [Pedobacter aquatilis]
MNLKKLSLGLVALVGFGLVITLNAFTAKTEKKAYSYWQFDSGNVSDIRDGASYTPISAPSSTPCESGVDLPCVLKVDESIDTEAELNTYLHDTNMFPNANSITNSAVYKKDAE